MQTCAVNSPVHTNRVGDLDNVNPSFAKNLSSLADYVRDGPMLQRDRAVQVAQVVFVHWLQKDARTLPESDQ